MSSILSSVEGGVIGVGVGTAAAAAVVPSVEPAKQEVWHANPYRVLDPHLLAELVVQALTPFGDAQDQAQRSGYDGNKFRAMVEATFKGPPVAEALELWRRGKITPEQMRHALHKSGIETQYVEPIMELFVGRLDPRIIATAIQRGIMDDPGFLPVGPPSAVGKVPKFPVSPLHTLEEAQAHGIDRERLFVETALVGLPASNEQAASAYFRGIIELADYYRAISEGNTRNEWRDAILDQARQILTAHEYAELELRGFLSKTQRRNGTAKHGMSDTDSDLLFDVLGRSVNVHQIVTGEARGGTYKPPPATLAEQTAGIPPAFLASLQRGNLRPEYYSIAYANRYTYPSFFAIRTLLTGGALTADEGDELLLEMGWKPSLARKVADYYGGGTATDEAKALTKAEYLTEFEGGFIGETEFRARLTDLGFVGRAQDLEVELGNARRVISSRNRALLALEKRVTKGSLSGAEAASFMTELEIPEAARAQLLAVWEIERRIAAA